jgi:hypothetical protein
MPGLAIQLLAVPVVRLPVVAEARDWCTCEFTCDWEELAFAGVDRHEKDFTSFLSRKVAAGDVLTFSLQKDGVEVAEIADNTYGTFYDFGDFAAQPLYSGWVANWSLVYAAFGVGRYQVVAAGTIAGIAVSFPSRYFRVLPYDARIAHRTVKLEGYQTGDIIGSDWSYAGLLPGGWYQSIRLNGWFGDYRPEIEVDDYLDTSYRLVQNRTQVVGRYVMTLEGIPHSVFRDVARDNLLGNELFVTDYEARADVLYRRFPVAIDNFEEVANWQNGRGRYRVGLVDRVADRIKRNY